MAIMCTCRILRSSRFSALQCGLLGLSATATLTDAALMAKLLYNKKNVAFDQVQHEPMVVIACFSLAIFMVGSFLCAGIRDDSCACFYTLQKMNKPKDEDDSSVFAKIFCTTLFPLIKTTVFPPKKLGDVLPLLRRSLHCKTLGIRLQTFLTQKRVTVVSRRHFMAAVLRVLWLDVFRVCVCTVAYFACLFIRVPVMEWLIVSSNSWDLSVSTLFFVVTVVAEFLVSCYQLELLACLGCRMRATLQAAIFSKVMRLSPTAKVANPSGYVVSLLGVDCFQLSVATYMFALPVIGVLLLPVLLYVLTLRAGLLPTLCCAAYLVVIGLASLPTSRLQDYLWFLQVRARDERLKRTSDLLSSVRLMKMYAWEKAYRDKVNSIRRTELGPLFWINAVDGLIDSVCSASSSMLTIILFTTLAIFEPNRPLTPATSFSCVYIIYMTDLITAQAASVLRSRSQVSLGLRRIVKFCTEEEQESRSEETKGEEKYSLKGEVTLKSCSFAWSKSRDDSSGAVLRNVSLNVRPGSLVGVVGFVGSGKSSLLAGILGDMHRLQGSVTCTGRVAYVPQIANVHNMSVRDNILYGTRMNGVNYERVLRSCQLHNDISKFPAGDITEVGEKGETLSGGQKQRVSLARAAYNQADVYLLDDPLSALDPVVAGRVFRDLIGNNGLLRDKTRIMVCNQGSFLSQMDQLVLVHNKEIAVYDSAAQLLVDPRSPETLRNSVAPTAQTSAAEHGADDPKSTGESDGRLMGQEQSQSTMTFWGLTWALLRLSGRCVPVAVLAFVACAVALGYQLVWIKGWTDSSTAVTAHGSAKQPDWLTGLLVLCVVDVLARSLGGVMLACSGAHLSQSMHREMLWRIVSSPVFFFDTTPRGRIMNRLSVDLDGIDSKMYLSAKQCLQNTLIMFARLAVVGAQAPTVLLVGAIAGVVMLFAFRITVRASRKTRFAESLAASRVLSHLTETMDALSSVRAYGVVERFCDHFCRLADANMRGYAAYCVCFRFVRAIAAVCGLVVLLTTLLLCVVGGTSDPSIIGLSLSAASTIPMSLMHICITLFTSLQMVVCFERCLEYTQLPPEEDVKVHGDDPKNDVDTPDAPEWPCKGKVEFDSYAASYRPGILPDVLRCVSFTVEPMQKVGVVGRTGAGKSSLALALLRVLRSSHGCIRIDGLDIAQVPLRKLRRGVTLIPQDPNLVRGSLRENLDPTNSHTDEEIWEALDQAHLKDLVSQDPERLLLETGEGGSNLSTGQRQLVCLARAILRRPRLLLLDEATSQMDGDTDRLIQATLREGFSHCTLITIAHRIHTVLDYDKILVMDDGRVREFGSVAELLSNTNSVFHRMAEEAGVLQSNQDAAITTL
ncbi:unnamed protein product [Ixodes hexagonus]